jgi:hypothetical protein
MGQARIVPVVLTLCGLGLMGCQSKVAVVCDKLEGCGLIQRSYDECVDIVETAYEEDRVDDAALTLCIDCLSFNFCDAIAAGECGDTSDQATGDPGLCGEVVQQLRQPYGG